MLVTRTSPSWPLPRAEFHPSNLWICAALKSKSVDQIRAEQVYLIKWPLSVHSMYSYWVAFFDAQQLLRCAPLQHRLEDLKRDSASFIKHWEEIPAPEYKSNKPTDWWESCERSYSQLMLFWSVRIHCWCKLIMAGRKTVLAPEYTCIFLLSRWPVKPADSSGTSQKSDSFSALRQNSEHQGRGNSWEGKGGFVTDTVPFVSK